MRNTWHGDCHVSRWIKKGVLHLDQKEFSGRKDRKKIKKRERKRERKGGTTSTSLQCSNKQEVRRIK